MNAYKFELVTLTLKLSTFMHTLTIKSYFRYQQNTNNYQQHTKRPETWLEEFCIRFKKIFVHMWLCFSVYLLMNVQISIPEIFVTRLRVRRQEINNFYVGSSKRLLTSQKPRQLIVWCPEWKPCPGDIDEYSRQLRMINNFFYAFQWRFLWHYLCVSNVKSWSNDTYLPLGKRLILFCLSTSKV